MSEPLVLYPFQRDGVEWLRSLDAVGDGRGGILADSMGLGKTLQTLVAAHEMQLRRVLVITLNSTRVVWSQALDKWFPNTDYIVIDANDMTQEIREHAIRDDTRMFCIMNYTMMRTNLAALERVHWDLVVFDEAHELSNRKSITHQASRRVTRKSATDRVWYCTGTPVQNHVQEYWPLLRPIVPGFGSYWQFAHKYLDVEEVIHKRTRQVIGHTVKNPTDPNDERVREFVETIRPYVLRRTKQQVYPDLPPKTYQRIPIALDKHSRHVYQQFETKFRAVTPNNVEVFTDTVLARDTRLLQTCVDWQLLEPLSHNVALQGPKADALREHVSTLQGAPFVVFSQWDSVVQLVRNMLRKAHVNVSTFTGANVRTRDAELAQWKRGETQGLLVTLAAGGVGLDFTHASTAFFLDRSWNPKANEQAEDRLYRHGQTQPVHIIDFYARDTIEEHVLYVDDTKERIADSVVEARQ